jgi:DNA-binding transcriptional ArsR family regulator
MADSREDEIYSTMFSSLKHPVRRKILRMLGNKPMTFMEMVEELGVSTPHLTYHLESLGELISKMDSGQYKLSAFGLATVSAMKGVEEVHEVEPKRRLMTFGWKAIFAVLLATVLVLASMAAIQYADVNNLNTSVNQLSSQKKTLLAENAFLTSGLGENRTASFLQNVTQIDITNYTTTLLSNSMEYSTDLGGIPEQNIQYSLKSTTSTLTASFRFRDGHFSRYALDFGESAPIFAQTQNTDVLQQAKNILARYQAYSKDSYLTNMTNLINAVNATSNEPVQGNIKLQMTVSGNRFTFLWMYTQDGIDFQAKGVEMVFQNNILTTMTDGYYLFTIGSTNLATSRQQAIDIAQNYIPTLTWTIGGQQVSHFSVAGQPFSVQLVPHTRGDSLALIPYWYIEMSLTATYAGGINEVTVGIYADTGKVVDIQMLAGTGA